MLYYRPNSKQNQWEKFCCNLWWVRCLFALTRLDYRAFIPKVLTAQNVNRKIKLLAFHPNPQNREERHLHCLFPVRALRYYVQKAQGVRKDRQLFVSSSGRNLGKKVSSQTLSRWICTLIYDTYKQMGRQIPVQDVNAHSTWAAAASLADLMGASVEDLCEAATWSSPLVFAKHYRLDYATERGISSQVLAAAMAIWSETCIRVSQISLSLLCPYSMSALCRAHAGFESCVMD